MKIAILTDTSAIFPLIPFAGQERLYILAAPGQNGIFPTSPCPEDFVRQYHQLETLFEAILVLAPASALLPVFESARLAARNYTGKIPILVLDSQHIGAALGILTKIACQAAQKNTSLTEIERQVRAAVPRLYHLVVASSPQNLSQYGLLATSAPLELNGPKLWPGYTLEEGQFQPFVQIRSRRHLLETFLEFIEEFNRPLEISFSRAKECGLRAATLRATSVEFFPDTPFFESEFSPALSAFFGPASASITILDE